jgi:hypothetical protein
VVAHQCIPLSARHLILCLFSFVSTWFSTMAFHTVSFFIVHFQLDFQHNSTGKAITGYPRMAQLRYEQKAFNGNGSHVAFAFHVPWFMMFIESLCQMYNLYNISLPVKNRERGNISPSTAGQWQKRVGGRENKEGRKKTIIASRTF